jgi:TonB family protein
LNLGVLGSCCALSAYLVTGMAWSAQAIDAVASRPGTEADSSSLQEWDRQQIELREFIWRSYGPTAALGKDSRGRTLADDLNDWLMTKDVQDRLSNIRATAERQQRKGDEKGARQTLVSGQAAMQEQRTMLALVNYYWEQRLALNRQRDLWLVWLSRSPEAAATPSKDWIDPLEANLVRDFSPRLTQAALTAKVESLKRAYDGERIKLATLVSDQRVGDGKVMDVRERRSVCPKATSDRDRSGRDGSTGERAVSISKDMSAGRFYPQDARRNGITGSVNLRLTIGPTGCMERAEVLRSSGAAELDEAAINLSEYVSYLPARHGDRQIRATFVRSIAFQSEGFGVTTAHSTAAPTTASGYITRGNSRLERGEYDLAITDFNKAIEIDATAAMAFADRGMAHVWQHKLDLAREDLDAAYRLNPSNPIVFHGRGMLALDANDPVGAIDAFTSALASDSHDSFALQNRAQAYLRTGERDKALADYTAAIQIRPGAFELHAYRALILRAQGRIDESIGEAESLMAANPDDAHAYAIAAGIEAASGKQTAAMHAFDRAIEISPDESTYLMRAAYRRGTDHAGERADVDAAVKLNPHSSKASISLAKMQSDAGDYAGALETLGTAMASQAENYELLTFRGIVYTLSGQTALAEHDFTAARTVSTSASALNNMCWSKATAGVALDTALADCDAAAAAAPHESAINDSRGFVLLRLGRYDEAIVCYEDALRIRPLASDSLYGRGLARRRQGKIDEANSDIRAALLIDARIAEKFAGFGLTR